MFLNAYSGPYDFLLQQQTPCQLPTYDLSSKKANINPTGTTSKNGHVRPLPNAGSLNFDIWSLAHAVKKAECAINLAPAVLNVSALGFILDHAHLFHWPNVMQNFRLADGAIGALDDFSQTGFAGRVAQGFCLMFMESRGYPYISRFKSFCTAASPPIKLTARTKTKSGKLVTVQLATPDFVCEDTAGKRAIAESKGGFVNSTTLSDIKGALREGLQQIGDWPAKFTPPIANSFAVCTFLRENSDPHKEESLLAWADPDGADGGHRVPENMVWQENYATWLVGMGYGPLAVHIREVAEPKFITTQLRLVDIGNSLVAFSVIGNVVNHFGSDAGAIAIGIQLDVLLKVLRGVKPTINKERRQSNLPGSFFADGTYLGLVPNRRFQKPVRLEIDGLEVRIIQSRS